MARRIPSRTDANQAEIVQALQAIGASVLDLHALGIAGAPDILVGWRGQDHLLEIKTESGEVGLQQKIFAALWNGRKPEVVRSVNEALAAIGARWV